MGSTQTPGVARTQTALLIKLVSNNCNWEFDSTVLAGGCSRLLASQQVLAVAVAVATYAVLHSREECECRFVDCCIVA